MQNNYSKLTYTTLKILKSLWFYFCEIYTAKILHFVSSLYLVLDDTRGGLDASSLHRATSMDISLYKKFRLLSCHRDTLSSTRNKAKI